MAAWWGEESIGVGLGQCACLEHHILEGSNTRGLWQVPRVAANTNVETSSGIQIISALGLLAALLQRAVQPSTPLASPTGSMLHPCCCRHNKAAAAAAEWCEQLRGWPGLAACLVLSCAPPASLSAQVPLCHHREKKAREANCSAILRVVWQHSSQCPKERFWCVLDRYYKQIQMYVMVMVYQLYSFWLPLRAGMKGLAISNVCSAD